jgi:hypothetical protein
VHSCANYPENPAFAASSKNAGDYTGTLRVIYTPSTL